MPETINSQELSIKLQEIKSMKYILDIENQDISYEDLKIKIDSLCKYNLIYLIVLNNYIIEMPEQVKKAIDKIVNTDNEELEEKYYKEYINKYKIDEIFKEYQDYIYIQRANDSIKEVEDLNYFKDLENSLIKYKHIQLALLFNILYDIKGAFVPGDFTDNLPQLILWIKENKEKPIEKLTNDEGVIMAALMMGYYERIFTIDRLSNFVENFGDIDEIIKRLPEKFGVENIVQVVFRIYLLKPHIINKIEFDDLVKSIKVLGEQCLMKK